MGHGNYYSPPAAPYGQQPSTYAYNMGGYYGSQQPQVVYVQQPQQYRQRPGLRGGGGSCMPCLAGLGLGCCLEEMCCDDGDCCFCII